jgi:hypothetical protein
VVRDPSRQKRALRLALETLKPPMLTSTMLYVLFIALEQQSASSAVWLKPELGVPFQFLYGDFPCQGGSLKALYLNVL